MSEKVTANNLEISYRLTGPEDAEVVMFSNSLMSNYTMWDDQIEALTRKYRVLLYDQRGHGGTATTPGPYTIRQLAEDAAALIETLGVGPVHFVGISMGGFTGQMLAVLSPQNLRSLSLCDTACALGPKSVWDDRIEAARTKGIEALADATLERWFTPAFHESDKEQLQRVRDIILGTGVDGFVGCGEAIREMDICGNLPDISVPTMVLVGRHDPGCTVAAAEVLHRGIAGSELVIIEDAAHLPNIEQADRFNAALLEFLAKQGGA